MRDRIRGCLKGVATGDAVGKQTEGLSHDSVRRWYPHGVRGFEGEPGSAIPRYAGNKKRKWLGEIVSAAREASISTHGGSLAIAGAAATAAAVSAAIDGALPAEIIDAAWEAVARAERQWPGAGGHTFARAVHQVHQDYPTGKIRHQRWWRRRTSLITR